LLLLASAWAAAANCKANKILWLPLYDIPHLTSSAVRVQTQTEHFNRTCSVVKQSKPPYYSDITCCVLVFYTYFTSSVSHWQQRDS